MYKTVRQGENSLQYTILPQTEEVLSGSGMKGRGRDYSPSIQVRQSRRCKTTKLILPPFCVILLMMAFMISSVAVLGYYAGSTAKISTAAERAANFVASVVGVSHRDDSPKSRKKELRMSEAPVTDAETMSAETIAASTLPTTVATASDRRTKPVWPMPAFKLFWRSSTSTPKTTPQAPIVEDQAELAIPNGPFRRFQYSDSQWDVIIRPTLTPKIISTTLTTTGSSTRTEANYREIQPVTIRSTQEPKTTTLEDVLITTKWNTLPAKPIPTEELNNGYSSDNYPLGKDLKGLKDIILDSDDDDGMKELEVNEDVLKVPSSNDQREKEGYNNRQFDTVRKTAVNLPKIWSFEPSMTLFQWQNGAQDDGVVVPLVLVAGTTTLLVGAALVITTMIRRRARQMKGADSLGKMAADLQPDDNTNLLTPESQEEE